MWQRLYLPHIPSLPKLIKDLKQPEPRTGQRVSATVLASLLASIALDVPSNPQELASVRHLQPALHATIFNFGQKMLFGLARHDYTLMALELIAACRPLALMSTQQAIAQALNGRLYPGLIKSVAQRLDVDSAPARLRASLDSGSDADLSGLVYNSLRWARCLIHDVYEDLGVERPSLSLRPTSTGTCNYERYRCYVGGSTGHSQLRFRGILKVHE